MAKACSLLAGKLSPEDKKRYGSVRGRNGISASSARRAAVESMLGQANAERAQIVAEIQRNHPNIVNNDGVLLEDLKAQRFENEAQTEMDLPEGKKDASKKAKAKTRSKKSSSAKVAKPKQPAGSKPTPKGAAALKRGTKGAGQQVEDPKVETKETEPSEPAKPEPAVRKKQQPADIIFEATDEWQNFPEGAIAPGGAEFRLSLTDPTQRQIRLIPTDKKADLTPQQKEQKAFRDAERARGASVQLGGGKKSNPRTDALEASLESLRNNPDKATWKAETEDILSVYLTEGEGGNSEPNKAAWKRAADISNGVGEEASLVWESKFAGADGIEVKKIASNIINDKIRSKTVGAVSAPKFKNDKTLWQYTIDQNMFAAVIARLDKSERGLNSVVPTNPTGEMLELSKILRLRENPPSPNITEERGDTVTNPDIIDDMSAGFADTSNLFEGDPDLDSDIDPMSYSYDDLGSVLGTKNSLVDSEGKQITKPMSMGTVKMAVSKFRKRLSKTINVRILAYKNVAELQSKNPTLYKEAQEAHEDKQVIPDNAAGVATGRTVIIFSDNIANRQHLAFVLSHEVVGHFGLGSIMPKAQFKGLLNDVYESDPQIKTEVDRMVEAGEKKYTAIEEALADHAADVDNSLLLRISDIIKRYLNRLGFKFNDDMTRYFVYQSRRYIRDGIRGDPSMAAVRDNLLNLESRAINTRYSTVDGTGNFHEGVVRAQGIIRGRGGVTERMFNALNKIVDTRGKTGFEGGKAIYDNALESLQTLGNMAKKNAGARKVYELLKLGTQEDQRLKNEYNRMTAYAHSLDAKLLKELTRKATGVDIEDGPTEAQLKEADRALVLWLHAKGSDVNSVSAAIRNSKDLLKFNSDGVPEINKDIVRELQKQRAMTKEQLEKGVEVAIIDGVTGEQRIDIVDGKEVPATELMEGLSISDEAWRVALELREAVDQADLDLLLNTAKAMTRNEKTMLANIRDKNEALTDADEVILKDVLETYGKLYKANSEIDGPTINYSKASEKQARQFLRDVTRVLDSDATVSTSKLNDWVNGSTDPRSKGTEDLRTGNDPNVQRVISKLSALNKDKAGSGIKSSEIESALAQIHMETASVEKAEVVAKNTILTSYVPLSRKGKYQVRIQAMVKNDKGKRVPIKLADSLESKMFMSRTDSYTDAASQAAQLNEVLTNLSEMELLSDGGEVTKGITFEAIHSTSLEAPPLGGFISYGEVINLLNRSGVTLSVTDRSKLVQMTATQGGGARRNLQRKFVPGFDPEIRKGVRKHLEQRASSSAKKLYQHELNDAFANTTDWNGDKERLKELQDNFLLAKGSAAEFHAKREMLSYQYQYVQSSSESKIDVYDAEGNISTVAGKKDGERVRTVVLARAESYQTRGSSPSTTGDEKLGDASGAVLSAASVAQLSLSVATSLVNMTAIATHSATYLATLNQKTGYGGGHGFFKASAALIQAGKDTSLLRGGLKEDIYGNVEGLERLVEIIKTQEKLTGKGARVSGLSLDEAEMLVRKTRDGSTAPNLTNALTGADRYGRSSNAITNTVGGMMAMFSKSEQYNRRVTALASYRLDKANMKMGKDGRPTADQQKLLDERIDDAVNYSQGNYDKFNYPTIAHGPILRYLYLYKLFQTITVEHMWSMAPKERYIFLGMILVTAGLTGLPFAGNFADLIDTLMEIFGLKWSGLEATVSDMSSAVGLPSGLVMRGAVDHYTGIHYSGRAGYGVIFPGTGMFKANAQPMRVIKDIAGPAYSAWEGIFGSAAMIGRYGLETVGLRPDATTIGDIARGAPVSALKNLAKGITYLADGTVVNDRGQTIVHNVGVRESLFQMLGFGPASVATAYSVNRIGEYERSLHVNYVKEMRTAYIKADRNGKRDILRSVRDTNRKIDKTSPFYIPDFIGKVRKKEKSNKLDATERSIKTLPVNLQKAARRRLEASAK